jgi:hypothetical protein
LADRKQLQSSPSVETGELSACQSGVCDTAGPPAIGDRQADNVGIIVNAHLNAAVLNQAAAGQPNPQGNVLTPFNGAQRHDRQNPARPAIDSTKFCRAGLPPLSSDTNEPAPHLPGRSDLHIPSVGRRVALLRREGLCICACQKCRKAAQKQGVPDPAKRILE